MDRQLNYNLYIIGFMGSGKSTVTEALHRLYGFAAIEMDEKIAEREGMSVAEIFRIKGEACFRKAETGLLRELAGKKGHIVSCGGGVPMREENVELLRRGGKTVLLTASPETILSRIGGTHDRPLLEGRKSVEGIRALMEKRQASYDAAADLTVATDGKSAEEIAREIMESL